MSEDVINKPSHYIEGRTIEPANAIVDWELNWCLGNVVKYVARAGRKDDVIQDLKKAQWYLAKEIETQERKRNAAINGTQEQN